MTAPDWSAMLASEEARAMAGKPAFRVRMACVAGIACPRCGAAIGSRCKRPISAEVRPMTGVPVPSCRERVWAMRALQRSPAMSRPPKVADVAPFLNSLTEHPGPDLGVAMWWDAAFIAWRLPQSHGHLLLEHELIEAPVRHGLVRLSVASSGAPVWVITEAGAEYAAGWRKVPA